MTKFTEEAILSSVTSEGMSVKKHQNGNFQVGWAKDVLGKVRDTEKVQILSRVVVSLQAQGYNAEVRLGHPDKQGNWKPYPCIWVNRVEATTQGESQFAAKIEALEAGQAEMKALLEKAVGIISAQAPKTKQAGAEATEADQDIPF